SDGHYVISGLAAGPYQVWTITPNMIADPVSQGYGYSWFGASKSVNLDGDEQLANIDLRLIRGSVITGRVTNADNKPVVAETITLQSVDQNGNPRSVSNSTYDEMYQTDDRAMRDPEGKKVVATLGYPERRTDDRGVFRFYGLNPGTYILCATKP